MKRKIKFLGVFAEFNYVWCIPDNHLKIIHIPLQGTFPFGRHSFSVFSFRNYQNTPYRLFDTEIIPYSKYTPGKRVMHTKRFIGASLDLH